MKCPMGKSQIPASWPMLFKDTPSQTESGAFFPITEQKRRLVDLGLQTLRLLLHPPRCHRPQPDQC